MTRSPHLGDLRDNLQFFQLCIKAVPFHFHYTFPECAQNKEALFPDNRDRLRAVLPPPPPLPTAVSSSSISRSECILT